MVSRKFQLFDRIRDSAIIGEGTGKDTSADAVVDAYAAAIPARVVERSSDARFSDSGPVAHGARGDSQRRRITDMINIYIGNLSYRATEGDIRQAFEQFGEVASVQIIKDRETGRSRGFAFVEMPNSEEAKQAIDELDSSEIAGRPVKINEARPRRERF